MTLAEAMAAEVAEPCGPRRQRAGSVSGYAVWEGKREDVKRSRARRKNDHGTTEEVRFQTSESARQLDQLHTMALCGLTAGVARSTCDSYSLAATKEHTMRGKLSKRHWGILASLFKRLRKVEGGRAAREVLAELEESLRMGRAVDVAPEPFAHQSDRELVSRHRPQVGPRDPFSSGDRSGLALACVRVA